jgi:hypothetical protein
LRKNPFNPRGPSTAVDGLESIFTGVTAESVKAWPAERAASAAESISAVREELAMRIAAVTHPAWIIAECVEALKPMIGTITEIPLLLQTGKDGSAMERIIRFSEITQKLLDIVPFLPQDRERDRLFEELNPVLRQLIEAFDARDLVLIGDLFEYEVAPRLTGLLPALQRCL